jgi:acetyl-CoA acetyltransferase
MSTAVHATVRIAAQAMATDMPSTFETDLMRLVGYDLTVAAATQELLSYEALGLTPDGTAEKFIADGDNTYGGRVVTNPSGGLLSKGHPLGATGLAQCAELVWQLRGQAGDRQVERPQLALQHNIGLGGAAIVTLYEKSDRTTAAAS